MFLKDDKEQLLNKNIWTNAQPNMNNLIRQINGSEKNN